MTEWTWMKVYENTKSQNNKNGSDNDINSDNINCADGRGDDDVKISTKTYPWQILISTLPTITDQVITRTIKHVSGTHSHGRRLHSKIIWLVESLPREWILILALGCGCDSNPCVWINSYSQASSLALYQPRQSEKPSAFKTPTEGTRAVASSPTGNQAWTRCSFATRRAKPKRCRFVSLPKFNENNSVRNVAAGSERMRECVTTWHELGRTSEEGKTERRECVRERPIISLFSVT